MSDARGISPSAAGPAELVALLKGHATKSVRLALACLKRWEQLEASGSAKGIANLQALCEAGGAEAAVAIMAAHGRSSAAISERGCRALATIAYGEHGHKGKVAAAGGAGAVCDAIGMHSATREVVVQGLVALANLAAGDDACKESIIAASGAATCAKTMVTVEGDVSMHLQALRLLANLTTSDAAISAVLTSGGVAVTVLSMASHHDDDGLAWMGCRVLANVAETAMGVIAVCDAGGAAAVVCALEVHDEEGEVQVEGCRALANLAFSAGAKTGDASAPEWRDVGRAAVENALAEQKADAPALRAQKLSAVAKAEYDSMGTRARAPSRLSTAGGSPRLRQPTGDTEGLGWLRRHASSRISISITPAARTLSKAMELGAVVSGELGGGADAPRPSLPQRALSRANSVISLSPPPPAPAAPAATLEGGSVGGDLRTRLARQDTISNASELQDWPAPPPSMPLESEASVAGEAAAGEAVGEAPRVDGRWRRPPVIGEASDPEVEVEGRGWVLASMTPEQEDHARAQLLEGPRGGIGGDVAACSTVEDAAAMEKDNKDAVTASKAESGEVGVPAVGEAATVDVSDVSGAVAMVPDEIAGPDEDDEPQGDGPPDELEGSDGDGPPDELEGSDDEDEEVAVDEANKLDGAATVAPPPPHAPPLEPTPKPTVTPPFDVVSPPTPPPAAPAPPPAPPPVPPATPPAAPAAPPAAPVAVSSAGDGEVIDLESIGFMALKRLVISHGVPKERASAVASKGHLRELAVQFGAPLRFV